MSFKTPSVPKPDPLPSVAAAPLQPAGSAQPLAMNFNVAKPMRPLPFLPQQRAGRRSLIGGSL